jgi:hypothetical protein
MLVFKPIIIKFDICRFSNWKLDWKPIQKWALFKNCPKLEKTSNKSTFLWDFHIFENHKYIMPKFIFWKFENWWVNGHIPKLLSNRYISLLLGTTQHWSLPSLLYFVELFIFSFHFMIFWTTSMGLVTRNLLRLLNHGTRTMHSLWCRAP